MVGYCLGRGEVLLGLDGSLLILDWYSLENQWYSPGISLGNFEGLSEVSVEFSRFQWFFECSCGNVLGSR